MLRLRPTGRHLVNVCTNLSARRWGERRLRGRAPMTGSTRREVSEDGAFTVHEEECPACEHAPVVQVNVANHDGVTPERVTEIVASLRAGEVPSSPAVPPVG
jgi:NADH-quinone oxidoreductase subunit E